jgi:hypothetical protein
MKTNISTVMVINEGDDGIWLVSFLAHDPGIELEQKTWRQRVRDPGVVRQSCLRAGPKRIGSAGRIRTCDQPVNSRLLYR